MADNISLSSTFSRNTKIRVSKRDRVEGISRFWTRPTTYELELVDRGDHIKVTTSYPDGEKVAGWWLSALKSMYPQDQCTEDGTYIKMKPDGGLTLKVDRKNGSFRIMGKKHWIWFNEHYDELLERACEGEETKNDLVRSLDECLGLGDVGEVPELLRSLPRAGAIKHGHHYIYRLWKGLLDKWLALGGEIVIASPVIDARRLLVIYLLAIKNHSAPFQMRILTQHLCDKDLKFKKVREEAVKILEGIKSPRDEKRKLLTKEKIRWAVENVRVQLLSFSCNFISGIISDGERGEILVTSARFHKNHFDFNRMDTVNFSKMTGSGLREFYLQPLGIFGSRLPGVDGYEDTGSLFNGTSGRSHAPRPEEVSQWTLPMSYSHNRTRSIASLGSMESLDISRGSNGS